MSLFIDRKNELNILEKRYKDNKAEFIMLYGRRRVGKTELIKQFCRNKPHVYYLCSGENDIIQLEKIVKRTAEFFHERIPLIKSWEDFFSYLSEKSKKRFVFVIDEFPYLVEKNNAMPSLFQIAWDEYLKDTKIFLILCGSSISMMEELLGYKNPLYGRRTGQLELKPLKLYDTFKFFPRYSIEKKVEAYSVLGNIPMYLMKFDDKKGIFENIRDEILQVDSILYKEPIFLLKEELRDPGTYLTILENMIKPVRMNEIANNSHIDIHKLPKYLNILQKLRFVKKIRKITEREKTKSTLYHINDNFFRFWINFVYPNISDIEEGNLGKVMEHIKNEFNSFVGYTFEEVSSEFLAQKIPFDLMDIGKWWGYIRKGNERKEIEIDLVALGKKEIGFFECKWKTLSEGKARKILEKLKEKSKYVKWNREKEFFGLVAKKVEGKKHLRNEGHLVFDLKDF